MMIKGNLQHEHLRVRNAARKLSNALDVNPNALRGIVIEPKEVANQDSTIRNIGLAGLLLALFVKVWH